MSWFHWFIPRPFVIYNSLLSHWAPLLAPLENQWSKTAHALSELSTVSNPVFIHVETLRLYITITISLQPPDTTQIIIAQFYKMDLSDDDLLSLTQTIESEFLSTTQPLYDLGFLDVSQAIGNAVEMWVFENL